MTQEHTVEPTKGLVLLAGGYDRNSPIQKHKLYDIQRQTYLFEQIIQTVEVASVGTLKSITIACPRDLSSWWSKWTVTQKTTKAPISILPDPIKNPQVEQQVFGRSMTVNKQLLMSPSYVITRTIPAYFSMWHVDEAIVAPVDSFYADYSFVPNLVLNKGNALVVAGVGDDDLTQYDTVKLSLSKKIKELNLRPSVAKSGILNQVYALTGILKVSVADLNNAKQMPTAGTIGETVSYLLSKGLSFDIIKANQFVDVGTEKSLKENTTIVTDTVERLYQ